MSEELSIPDLLELAKIKELLQTEAKNLARKCLTELVEKYPEDQELSNLLAASLKPDYFETTTAASQLKIPLSSLIQQGIAELDKGNLSIAYSLFKNATEQYPQHALAWLWLATNTPTLALKKQILQHAASIENSIPYIGDFLQVLEMAEESWPVNQRLILPLNQPSTRKVLVVDALSEVRQSIGKFFELLTWQVYPVADLLDATKTVSNLWQEKSLTFDIIICADNLPYLGAITFFELLKNNPVYSAKPFIIKSVSGPILPYKFDEALAWPASDQEIYATLSRWL